LARRGLAQLTRRAFRRLFRRNEIQLRPTDTTRLA
jgi:hypothetical protein